MSTEIALSRVDTINQLHREILALRDSANKTFETAYERAKRIGEELTAQKAECKHGTWLPWLAANVEFHEQTARRYMAVYARRDEFKSNTVLDLTAAYRLLAPPPKPRAAKPKPAPVIDAEVVEDEEKPAVHSADREFHDTSDPDFKAPVPSMFFDADKETDALFHLKSYWRKATKKDRRAFLQWATV